MDKASFIKRLVKQIPRPGFHLVRYFGGFAPRARIRPKLLALVEPRGPVDTPCMHNAGAPPVRNPTTADSSVAKTWTMQTQLEEQVFESAVVQCPQQLQPTGLAEQSPVAFIRQRRLSWAQLLKRTFSVDVLHCPNCNGRLRVIAAIDEPVVVKKVLPGSRSCKGPARAAGLR